MAADLATAKEVLSNVEAAHAAGTLTKRQFFEAWRKTETALGDGPEAEGIEALCLYAEADWLKELEVIAP